jgi:hypothetical protein
MKANRRTRMPATPMMIEMTDYIVDVLKSSIRADVEYLWHRWDNDDLSDVEEAMVNALEMIRVVRSYDKQPKRRKGKRCC